MREVEARGERVGSSEEETSVSGPKGEERNLKKTRIGRRRRKGTSFNCGPIAGASEAQLMPKRKTEDKAVQGVRKRTSKREKGRAEDETCLVVKQKNTATAENTNFEKY